ncbi:uncharacterized protein LOC122396053 isoform X2 [Colletes gigas]|uniref:uncharacterized protein LOC122396053 isoform X2 n=1 Tax=Colletes gigas TaxID=935657 RepID=UPI001C9A662C|nr:uncharacterized protein LOC122396053 isoform X2 [Colletes gigas]
MVNRRRFLQDDGSTTAGTDNRIVPRYRKFHGYRRRNLIIIKVLKKMLLTPRRSGSISPEEIDNGPETKDLGTAENGSVTPGAYENGEGAKEFLTTGRTGRRNAMPNILGRHAEIGLLDLSNRFKELSTHTDRSSSGGQNLNAPGTSKQQD